jgi:hypothetical protein
MPYVNIKVTREGTAPGASATTSEQKATRQTTGFDLRRDRRSRDRLLERRRRHGPRMEKAACCEQRYLGMNC